MTNGDAWADYAAYTDDGYGTARHAVTIGVSIDGEEVSARALSVCEDLLVVAVSPVEAIGVSLPAGVPVAVETPEETATARLTDLTFDIEAALLSFERVDGKP